MDPMKNRCLAKRVTFFFSFCILILVLRAFRILINDALVLLVMVSMIHAH